MEEIITISKKDLGILLYDAKCWELQCEEDGYYGSVGIKRYADGLGLSSSEEVEEYLVTEYLSERN
jgi:hypothetical protein